jgi:hypothetical protein
MTVKELLESETRNYKPALFLTITVYNSQAFPIPLSEYVSWYYLLNIYFKVVCYTKYCKTLMEQSFEESE